MQITEYFVILGHFHLILSFYTSVPQTMIIWCMVPEIASMTDIIFCHSRLFLALLPPNNPENQNFEKNEKISSRYYHFKHEYHKWKSWCMIPEIWIVPHNFFVILGYFLPFYPYNNQKNKNFKKNEKNIWRYHHFTQVYQRLWSYAILFLRYGTWWI